MKLGRKVLTISVAGTVITSLIVVGVICSRQHQVREAILRDADQKAKAECMRLATYLRTAMEIAHEGETAYVRSGLAAAARELGVRGFAVDQEPVEWQAVNQFDQSAKTVKLPKFLAGGEWLGQNRDPSERSALVDEITEVFGGSCTVFQRMNDDGDMLRVCTSVINANGQRGVGTYIPAVNPDGTPNAVVATLVRGEKYLGRAFVVDAWCNTGYEPIFDEEKKVVGAIYFGRRQDSIASLRKLIMDTTIGESGYPIVLQGKGKDRGTYIISNKLQRDGENALELVDAAGERPNKKIVDTAVALQREEAGLVEFAWQNKDEPAPRQKLAAVAYFEPWDWVIAVTAYKDDFHLAVRDVSRELDSMIAVSIASCVVVACGLAAIALYASRRITRPLLEVSRSLKEIANGDGDLTRRLQINSRDEVGELCGWFNVFIEKLQGIMGRVAGTATELGTVSGDMFATSTQLAQGAQDTTAKSASVAAAAEEVSTTMDVMTKTSREMAENVNSAAAAVEEMTSSINDIAKNAESAANVAEAAAGLVETSNDTISRLSDAAHGIGKVIEVIEDIAEETGLLALNATIEAARAGESGKGFAVVATEVKELARQTREATEDIRARIEGIQTSSRETVTAISNIRSTIDQVKGVSRTIAAAVQEQSIATQEIARNVTKTSDAASSFSQGLSGSTEASKEIARNIASVDQEARTSLAGANHAKETGDNLAALARQLQELVGKFKA